MCGTHVIEAVKYRKEDNAPTQRVLKLNGRPPLGRVDIGRDKHILAIELDLTAVDGNTVFSCVDKLVEFSGLHSVALELVDKNDIVLIVSVPVLARALNRSEREDVAAGSVFTGEKMRQTSGKRSLSGTSGAEKHKADSLLVMSTTRSGVSLQSLKSFVVANEVRRVVLRDSLKAGAILDALRDLSQVLPSALA